MAFPSVVGAPVTSGAAWADTVTGNFISGMTKTAGNLLLCFYFCDAGEAAPTSGQGWTSLYSQANTEQTSNVLYVVGKVATGSDTLTFTRTGNTQISVIVCEIADWYGSLTDNEGLDWNVSFAFQGGLPENNPDPPSLTTAWAAADNMWLCGWCYNDGTTANSTFPTGWTANKIRTFSNGQWAVLEMSYRTDLTNTQTEDPGTILNGPTGGIAFTMAIRPAAGSTAKPFIYFAQL